MSRATRFGVLVAAACAGGCGQGNARVSGEVTYDGVPVKTGYVTFHPADGKGPAAAARIADGRYAADDVPPGPKTVEVEASTDDAPSIQTAEQLARMTPEQKARFDPKTGVISADVVPRNAAGNNQKVEVRPGSQTLDLHLKKPPARR